MTSQQGPADSGQPRQHIADSDQAAGQTQEVGSVASPAPPGTNQGFRTLQTPNPVEVRYRTSIPTLCAVGFACLVAGVLMGYTAGGRETVTAQQPVQPAPAPSQPTPKAPAQDEQDDTSSQNKLSSTTKNVTGGTTTSSDTEPYLTAESANYRAFAREGSVDVVTKGGEEEVLKIPVTGKVSSLLFGEDGKSIAIVGKGTGDIEMWSLETKQRL